MAVNRATCTSTSTTSHSHYHLLVVKERMRRACLSYCKRHFYAHEKIMLIGQNGPLDKFTRFLFMRLNVPCIVMYGMIKIYATAA